MEVSVDLSSFPLLRIDQVSIHETSVLVDSEAQLSALGRDEDVIEPSITPFVSKLLVHIRKELAARRENGRSVVSEECTRVDGWSHHCSLSNDESSTDLIGQGRRDAPLPPSTGSKDMPERSTRTVADSSTPARSHSSPSSRPPNYPKPNDRATTILSSCEPSFFVSSNPVSKSSSFRSRAKQAQASLRARSNEATTRRSEQERHERTRQALETMQDWRAERERSRKRREELSEMERGLRVERQMARMERERHVRSSMHAAAEEAKAKALASGCTDEDAIVEAAAAAAKVVDDESTVFQCADSDSDDGSFINGEYTDGEESSASKLSSDEMLQVHSSFVIANDESLKKGCDGCPEVSESCLSPNQSNLPAASDPTPGPQICSECIVEPIKPSSPGKPQLEKSGESTKTDSGSLVAVPPRLSEVPPPPLATLRWTQDLNDDDDRTSTSSESADDIETKSRNDRCFQAHTQEKPPLTPPNETHRSLLTTAGKMTLKEAAKPCRVMAAPDKKYDIFPSFSGIFVDPAGGHMHTSDADVRQSELSKSLQNQIAQYTKMSTAFASLSLEEASDLSDCTGAFDRGLFYNINSRRPEVASIIRRAFSNSSWSELPPDVEGNCWNLMWVWGLPKASTFENLLVFQRINRFRDTRGLTRKDLLKKNMDSSNFTPLTYALPHEWNQFVAGYQSLQKANHNKADNYWIMKPVGLSRGRGISVVNDIADVSYSRPIVIQRYIQNPLCFMGYKFDLRMYVLVTFFSPLEAFIYKDGLARFGSRQYSLGPESLKDRRIHLTNSSVQKEYTSDEVDRSHPTYLAGSRGYESKVAFTWLWKRLEGIDMDTKELWRKLVDVCRTALITTGSDIQHQPNSFKIFGYDLIFDQDLKCWLIEVNSSPSLACDSMTRSKAA